MGGDVKNIKEEVTKTLNVDELIVDLHKCSTQAEKEKIIIIIKKYDFKELISGKQLLSILGHFSGKKRVDLSIELSKYLRPDLSSAQFFQIITPDMDMQEFGYVFPPFSIKMGEPLKFIDYIEHINKVAKGGMNRTYQATVLAGNLEHINGNQKAQIADLLGVEVSMVDGYL
jgi:hypothetical protein